MLLDEGYYQIVMTMMGTQIDEELYENPGYLRSPLSKDIDDMYGFVYCIIMSSLVESTSAEILGHLEISRGKSRRAE